MAAFSFLSKVGDIRRCGEFGSCVLSDGRRMDVVCLARAALLPLEMLQPVADRHRVAAELLCDDPNSLAGSKERPKLSVFAFAPGSATVATNGLAQPQALSSSFNRLHSHFV